MVMVAIGPIMPVCAVSPGPIRSMAIITISTGATVQAEALSSDSHITCGAMPSSDKGRSSTNCKMQHKQATVLASLRHLAQYSFVAERVAAGTLALHGWYFHFGWGVLQAAAGPEGPFHQLDPQEAPRPAIGS